MADPVEIGDLLLRWEELQEQGQTVYPEELCRDCPELLEELQRQVRALQLLRPVLETSSPPATCGDSVEAPAALPDVPGYEVLGELGRGGMGVVYKARQIALKRFVALKMVRAGGQAGAEELTRFAREAETVACLQHPNIVPIYEVGSHRGLPWFAMELVAGGSLDRKLAGTPLPASQAAQLVETLARAMHHAHQQGIVHRDLKPANILLSADGTPRISDFGLAKILRDGEGQTQSGAILGTPSYMAPEQAGGKSRDMGPAADTYALGAILYELLTGRPPFRAATPLDTVVQVISEEPVPPRRLQPTVPADLETVCLKCLEKAPAKRYASAEALADELRRYLRGEPIHARPIRPWQRLAKWARRQPGIAALTALVVLVTLLGFAGVFWQWRQAEMHRQSAEARAVAEAQARQSREEALRRAQRHLYFHQIGLADRDWWKNDLAAAGRFLAAAPQELRNQEWSFLDWRCRSQLLAVPTLSYTVAFSPDGRLLATGWGNEVYLWDAAGRRVRTLRWPDERNRSIYRVVFSPDGAYLAAGGDTTTVPVWKVGTGELAHRLGGHPGRVHRLAFSPDGSLLACGTGTQRFGEAWLWNLRSGQKERTLAGHVTSVDFVAYSPDGKRVATAAWDHSIRIFDPATGKQVRSLAEHVHALAFSPDSRYLAATCVDHTIKIWDVHSGAEVQLLRGHTDAVGTLAFDGHNRLASAGADTAIRIWNWRTGELLQVLRGAEYRVQQVVFSPAGDCLASAGPSLKVWNLEADQEVRLVARHTDLFALNRDGSRLAAAMHDNHTVTLWDTLACRVLRTTPGTGQAVTALALDPAGALLLVGYADGTVALTDAVSGRLHKMLSHPGLRLLAVSPDGKRLATAGAAGSNRAVVIRLWELSLGQLVGEWSTTFTEASGLAFGQQGQLLVVCGRSPAGQLVQSFDAAGGQPLSRWPTADRARLACDPRGLTFATGSRDGGAVLANVRTGQENVTLKARTRALSFSPDGLRLATADKAVTLWDTEAGIESLTLTVPARLLTDTYLTDAEKATWGIFITDVQIAERALAARTCEGSLWLWCGETPPARPLPKTTLTFDRVPPGQLAEDALGAHGIRMTSDCKLRIRQVGEADAAVMVLPLGRDRVLDGFGEPVQLTETRVFHFEKPLAGFGFTCVGVRTGSSLPRWRLEALDARGNILATTGEMEFSKDPLPRTYHVRADGITAVRWVCDNRGDGGPWATFTCLPLVAIVLEHEPARDEPRQGVQTRP